MIKWSSFKNFRDDPPLGNLLINDMYLEVSPQLGPDKEKKQTSFNVGKNAYLIQIINICVLYVLEGKVRL